MSGADETRARSEFVLVPVAGGPHADETVEFGVDVARDAGVDLLIAGPVTDGGVEPDGIEAETRAARKGATYALRATEYARAYGEDAPDTSHVVLEGSSVVAVVEEIVATHAIRALVIGRDSGIGTGGVFRDAIDRLFDRVACDVVVAPDFDRSGSISRILVPVAGGPHSDLAVDVARSLARGREAWIEVLHVREDGESEASAERCAATALERLGGYERADTWILDRNEGETVGDAIATQSTHYDLAILGAPTKSRLRRLVFGSTTDRVERDAKSGVSVVRRHGGDG